MKLSSVDYQVLSAARRENLGYHLATQWYFGFNPLPYQYAWHHIPTLNSSLLAGIGCVAGDTLILAPDGSEIPIAELAASGRPIDVVAWDGSGFVAAKASQPFLKGRADLYRVTLSNGQSVTTTMEHRFLTPSGYVALKELRVGQLVGVLPTQDRSIPSAGEDRCWRKAQDCLDRCFACLRRCDGQLRPDEGICQFSAPSPSGEGEYTRLNSLQDGSLEREQGYIRSYRRSCPHSMMDFSRRSVGQPSAFEPRSLTDSPARSLGRLHLSLLRFGRSSYQIAPFEQFGHATAQGGSSSIRAGRDQGECLCPSRAFVLPGGAHFAQCLARALQLPMFQGAHTSHQGNFSLDATSSCAFPFNTSEEYCATGCSANVSYRKIDGFRFVGEGDFYDLVVPGSNSYVGNGIVHHNSGKTSIASASYAMDCISIPGFKALNASVTAKQAELAFDMVNTWMENNKKFANLVTDTTLRPYPIISFWNGSVYEFRTAGQGAKFIRGSEYDRINYDEPGLDEDGEAIRVLRGRLRGTRADGSPRMARLDVTGTPTAAVWFRERFEIGEVGHRRATPQSLKFYRSMRVTTYMNTYLTKEQIAAIEAEYPPEMVEVEMNAQWPDFGMSTFPHSHIQACVDRELNDEMEMALRPEDGFTRAGYEEIEWPRVGVVFWKKPAKVGRLYIMAGDPGVDTPPRRNSPCIMVFDVTRKPAEMVYFHWASGKGSYDPFMNSYKRAIEEYRPLAKGIDTTGPQKALGELGFEKYGIQLDSIHFGGAKEELINSLLVSITAHELRFPAITGLLQQLQNYRREDDKDSEQDIVMTLAMIAYLYRRVSDSASRDALPKSAHYTSRKARTNSGRRKRH